MAESNEHGIPLHNKEGEIFLELGVGGGSGPQQRE